MLVVNSVFSILHIRLPPTPSPPARGLLAPQAGDRGGRRHHVCARAHGWHLLRPAARLWHVCRRTPHRVQHRRVLGARGAAVIWTLVWCGHHLVRPSFGRWSGLPHGLVAWRLGGRGGRATLGRSDICCGLACVDKSGHFCLTTCVQGVQLHIYSPEGSSC